MRIEFTKVQTPRIEQPFPATWSREKVLRWSALAAIVALAVVLRFGNLSALGYANHYYAAAVDAMSQSWHNFFFVAAEPGGSVSVDKPPVGLWFQVFSARLFGVNGFSLLLPELIAGILSVLLLYHLVRQSFGTVAGLAAALALAITPVAVATDRNNTMDSTLVLTLLLAAWAFIRATRASQGDSTRGSPLRYLLLGSVLVGVAFNIKMLEAFLPVPTFFALYLLGSKEHLWRKFANLALATIVLLAISFSWATIVDLTPASQRPYVGSSGDNSELSLIFGYNGLERLIGMRTRGGLTGFLTGLFSSAQGQGGRGLTGGPTGGFFGGGLGGGFNTGRPGVLRLFTAPLSNEMSWLLPFGLLSALLLVFRNRIHWPIGPKHQAIVLWGGWLITGAIFFSIAGFFHPYYLTILAPPTAALVGIGLGELWLIRSRHPWLAIVLLIVGTAATLWVQITTAQAYAGIVWWIPFVVMFVGIGLVLLLVAAVLRQVNEVAITGFALMIAAIMLTPAIWSGLTTLNASPNQSLPAAYEGRSPGPTSLGGLQVNNTLVRYLQANTQNTKWMMAVLSSMQGADYVLATGRPVFYLGGFMGQDRVLTSASLAQLVNTGQLRYVYWDARGRGFGTQSDISSWVTSHCSLVNGFDVATQNSGAPDGTGGNAFQGRGGMQVSLYDCGK